MPLVLCCSRLSSLGKAECFYRVRHFLLIVRSCSSFQFEGTQCVDRLTRLRFFQKSFEKKSDDEFSPLFLLSVSLFSPKTGRENFHSSLALCLSGVQWLVVLVWRCRRRLRANVIASCLGEREKMWINWCCCRPGLLDDKRFEEAKQMEDKTRRTRRKKRIELFVSLRGTWWRPERPTRLKWTWTNLLMVRLFLFPHVREDIHRQENTRTNICKHDHKESWQVRKTPAKGIGSHTLTSNTLIMYAYHIRFRASKSEIQLSSKRRTQKRREIKAHLEMLRRPRENTKLITLVGPPTKRAQRD